MFYAESSRASADLVVTGASGFLGTVIVAAARDRGLSVRPVVRTSIPGTVAADVRDLPALRAAMRGARTVIHSAGLAHVFGAESQNFRPFHDVNVSGTENAVRSAIDAGIQHFILVSSVAVYGAHDNTIIDETHSCKPLNAYALSKLQAEKAAVQLARNRLRLTILRMATIYGEGDRGNVARLIRAIARRRFLLVGNGHNRKTLIHRLDAADACVRAAEQDKGDVEIWNVAGDIYRLRDIIYAISTALNVRVPRLPINDRNLERVLAVLRRTGGGSSSFVKLFSDDAYDGSCFAKRIGFSASLTLEEGIQRQVAAEIHQNCSQR